MHAAACTSIRCMHFASDRLSNRKNATISICKVQRTEVTPENEGTCGDLSHLKSDFVLVIS